MDEKGLTGNQKREELNRCRHKPGPTGHYESYFQRANHPTRPLAFWVRYTIFSPKNRPHAAIGETWAIWFDGEKNEITAEKKEQSLYSCIFRSCPLDIHIGESHLGSNNLTGKIENLCWDLQFECDQEPLLLLPEKFYDRGFPKAKALVASPNARYRGKFRVKDHETEIDSWQGSQNHNWGTQHTDFYAWGQVAGFDNQLDAFLECASARLRIGPLWSPMMTLINLRIGNRSFPLNSLVQAFRANAHLDGFQWEFQSKTKECEIRGRIEAPMTSFVGLRYYNPPGGEKYCLNSKIARCRIWITLPGEPEIYLESAHSAAFEILSDEKYSGVPIVA